MTAELAYLFFGSMLISLSTFGGGAQALFYQMGVLQTHWITRTDLSAVLAFGYATPGPAVFGTATFIGYKLGGVAGAVIGTAGIFIMPFILSLVAVRYFGHLLENPHAAAFIKGVGLAVAGLVAATAIGVLAHQTSVQVWQLLVAAAALGSIIKWDINPVFILLVGGIIGFLL